MLCRLTDIKNKQVISIKDGTCIGYVSDIELDISCAKILSIVIFGKLKFFGLLGRHEDLVIKWEHIEVIGNDTILVNFRARPRHHRKFAFLNNFFRN